MIVKCQWCEGRDTDRNEMEFEMSNEKKPRRLYFHKHCYPEHLKKQAFLDEERAKKDALNETLKQIYGVKEVPNQAWTMLANLREGNPVFGKHSNQKNMTKRYKEGYDYLLIKETFEYCSDTIEYWNGRKNFQGFMGAFTYAMSIIIDKIYVVEQRVLDRERQRIKIEKHIETEATNNDLFESSFKKKKQPSVDITDFLD